jgi:plasmid stabilization system protein ParE
MKYILLVYPAADRDVDEIAAHIARDSVDAANRCLDAVEETFDELRRHPERWPRHGFKHPRLQDVRKRMVIGFRNYSCSIGSNSASCG